MLETPEERVKLLKAGLTGKIIENLYIEGNKFKIIRTPSNIELVELDIMQKNDTCVFQEVAVESS